MTYVVADTPPGTATSLPLVPAITTPELAIVRLHGRRSEMWGARDAQVVEKYRYLYDREELEEWLTSFSSSRSRRSAPRRVQQLLCELRNDERAGDAGMLG